VVESPLALDFLEHWRAPRGIDRATASVVIGEWLLAVDHARREAAGVGPFDDAPNALLPVRRARLAPG
jgi:hypothetical protein